MFISILQEYIQKNSLPLPVYCTSKDGDDHLPQFKCIVIVNDAQYQSPEVFKHKKEAENAAAQAAIEALDPQLGERGQPKHILDVLASKKNIQLPTYQFTREGKEHCPTFTATVEINGASYTGAPGNNTKEAAGNAAYEAIRSIRIQDCSAPVEQPEQDPIPGEQQHLLIEETRDLYRDKDHGSMELEGKQPSYQDVVLIESTGKRSISEVENGEQMSKRKKSLKRKSRSKRR